MVGKNPRTQNQKPSGGGKEYKKHQFKKLFKFKPTIKTIKSLGQHSNWEKLWRKWSPIPRKEQTWFRQKVFSFTAAEVAIKKKNFLPVILFQARPIPVSGESIRNVRPHVIRIVTDLQLTCTQVLPHPKPVSSPAWNWEEWAILGFCYAGSHSLCVSVTGPWTVGAGEIQTAGVKGWWKAESFLFGSNTSPMEHVSFGAFQTTSKTCFLVWIKKARQNTPQCICTSQDIDEGRQLRTHTQGMEWSFSELF